MEKKAVRMTSKLGTEFDTEVVVGKEKYLVQTEDGGKKKPVVITRIYLNGQILLTRKTDYSDEVDFPDMEERVMALMQRQHRMTIHMARAGTLKKTKSTSEYLDEVKGLLKNRSKRSALRLLSEALEQYPDDPFLLSYYGCLEAVANKNYTEGIDTCHLAIEVLKRKVPFGEDFFFPVFYLNLGRAYLAAGKRKEALDSFYRGLEIERENKDLLWEVRKLGIRRKPLLPFLQRSNPINKYIGKMLHSLKR